ncbi:hypothetical protein [Pedobacter sp. MW01-1-1]|uniref:hypothetical protein n=1 Tax=Pedobacter sp. MW01-1-1 TaxID=3383027 RepID=UPI003FEE6036
MKETELQISKSRCFFLFKGLGVFLLFLMLVLLYYLKDDRMALVTGVQAFFRLCIYLYVGNEGYKLLRIKTFLLTNRAMVRVSRISYALLVLLGFNLLIHVYFLLSAFFSGGYQGALWKAALFILPDLSAFFGSQVNLILTIILVWGLKLGMLYSNKLKSENDLII